MERYLVIYDTFKGSDLIQEEVEAFESREAAESKARQIWGHLTEEEKDSRSVSVELATEEDLEDYAVDEETGEIDWTLVKSSTTLEVLR